MSEKPPIASKSNNSGYLPSLDGWRAIAVSLVIFGHAPSLNSGGFVLRNLQNLGQLGVEIFFAISGLLITSRLMEEKMRNGSFSLRGFYIRRVMRIQPASQVYLWSVVLLAGVAILPINWPGWFSAMFLYRNYFSGSPSLTSPNPDTITGHFWSLAVEEHFYLVLPLLLRISRSAALPVLAGLGVLSTLWTLVYFTLCKQYNMFPDFHHTDVGCRTLLWGSTLAILALQPASRKFLQQWLRPWQPLLLLLVLYGTVHWNTYRGDTFIIVQPLAFVLMVTSTVLRPQSLLSKFLELAPLRFLGRISYSLYLWHVMLTGNPEVRPLFAAPFDRLQSWPFCLVVLLGVATASYYLVERPLMRLGHRLAPPVTPGRTDLVAPTP
jgi:peptidoglycan/LPS O-acetylase OafA/YrhL